MALCSSAKFLLRHDARGRQIRRAVLMAEVVNEDVKLCPRCEQCDIPLTASICYGCEDEIREDAAPDGRWVFTEAGCWLYE